VERGGDACIAQGGSTLPGLGDASIPRPYATGDDHPINLPLKAGAVWSGVGMLVVDQRALGSMDGYVSVKPPPRATARVPTPPHSTPALTMITIASSQQVCLLDFDPFDAGWGALQVSTFEALRQFYRFPH